MQQHKHLLSCISFGIHEDKIKEILASCSEKLLSVRSKRVAPGLDDKVLTSWNSLMITAFAKGYRVTGERKYLDAAKNCVSFIETNLLHDVKLLRTYKNNTAKIDGYLEDYSYFANALLDVFEIEPESKYLDLALKLSQWKIFDNLRRSLVAPALVLLLLFGWTLLSPAWLWTLAVLAVLLVPAVCTGIVELIRKPADTVLRQHLAGALHAAGFRLAQAAFTVACLPFEACLNLDAILRSSVRVLVTRRRLLEWTPAAQISRALGKRGARAITWRRMASAPLTALAVGLLLVLLRPAWLAPVSPVLLAWLVSPQVAQWLSRPLRHRQPALTSEQRAQLGAIARRTWLFYERFVGPEDHWLPPDHFQESPRGQAAHHTSPTNIGFLLLSGLAASDLGYVGLLGLALRLNSTLDTLDSLERHRGHFLNWYDTRTLAPLTPRYVSTVDSGNLAGCLIALAQGCLAMPETRLFGWERWQGLLDTLALLGESLQAADETEEPSSLNAALAELVFVFIPWKILDGCPGVNASPARQRRTPAAPAGTRS